MTNHNPYSKRPDTELIQFETNTSRATRTPLWLTDAMLIALALVTIGSIVAISLH